MVASVPGSEPISLDQVVVAIRPGTQVGSGRRNCTMCGPTPIHWDAAAANLRPEAFSEQFFDILTGAGYRVVGNPRQMFDRQAERASARFLVGAQITGMEFTLDQIDWAFTGPSSKGDARLNVAWQIYSLSERRVVYETQTTSTGTLHRAGFQGALSALLHNAFSDAIVKLGADRGFQNAVARVASPGPAVTSAAGPFTGTPFELPRFAPFTGPAANRLVTLSASTVTILLGSGHGSGFFVSDDGLILTNRHVVGSAEQVNVRLAGGVEVIGRVLRSDAVRDVALVKIDIARARPLPISTTAPAVGNEVYAMGSPSDPNLAGTLTRGIVSALRTVPRGGVELSMIQSDAAIYGGNSGGPLMDASGNVIGIAVSGLVDRGQNTAINFFIPIDDALRYLNMRLGQPRELRF
jgi:serine protease Do